MESFKKELADGQIEYRNQYGFYHRYDGPAIIYADGTQNWYIEGYCYRDDNL
jgi:hypothetical protein